MRVDEGSEDEEEQIGEEEEEEARITLLYLCLWSPRWKESIFTSQTHREASQAEVRTSSHPVMGACASHTCRLR